MGGFTKAKNKTKNLQFPKFATDYFRGLTGYGEQEMGLPVTTGVEPTSREEGPERPLFGQAVGQVQDTLGGKYLRAEENPYLSGVADEVTRRGQENLEGNLAGLDNSFNRAGLNLSSPLGLAKLDTMRKSNEDITGQILDAFAQNYARERAGQQGAVGQATNLYNMPLDRLLQISQALKAGGTSTSTSQPSPFDTAIQSLQAIGSIAGSMMGCWVAEAVFGNRECSKFALARYYIFNHLPVWMVDLYMRKGQRWAKSVKRHMILRWLLRPAFEYFAWMGKRKIKNYMEKCYG